MSFSEQIRSSADFQVRQKRSACLILSTVYSNTANFNASSFADARFSAYTTSTNANALFQFNSNLSNLSNIGLLDGRVVINISADTLNVPISAYTFDLDVKDSISDDYKAFASGTIDIQTSRP